MCVCVCVCVCESVSRNDGPNIMQYLIFYFFFTLKKMASSTVVRLSCAEKAALVPCAKRGQGYIEGSVPPAREVFTLRSSHRKLWMDRCITVVGYALSICTTAYGSHWNSLEL